jgi:hypothetical protein
MFLDATLGFLLPGNPQSMVSTAGTAIQIGNIYDLLGQGVGVVPSNTIIGNSATFGTDFGIGAEKMQLQVVVGTAFTTSTAATLDVYFQGAPDNGSAQPGTWQVFQATGPLTAAQLTAGQIIARMDWPPSFPANEAPRFVRLLGVVPSGTDFTAGTISYAIIVPARDDTGQKYAQRNYTAPSVV